MGFHGLLEELKYLEETWRVYFLRLWDPRRHNGRMDGGRGGEERQLVEWMTLKIGLKRTDMGIWPGVSHRFPCSVRAFALLSKGKSRSIFSSVLFLLLFVALVPLRYKDPHFTSSFFNLLSIRRIGILTRYLSLWGMVEGIKEKRVGGLAQSQLPYSESVL